MNSLRIFLVILFLCLTSCQTTLQKAGQSHALTFQKWQALAQYAGASQLTNHPSIFIVGELKIDSSGKENKFVLTNIKLSSKETQFQINLLHPQFESKYICAPQCLQLTEYLEQAAEGNTMLTRYFNEHEFELFKFYAEVFSLDEIIKEKFSSSGEHFEHYMNWVINQQLNSEDITTFIVHLKRIFSDEEYVSYTAKPEQVYSHLVQSATKRGLGIEPSETVLWTDTNTENQPEMILWNLTEEHNDGINLAEINIEPNARIKLADTDVEPGDLVCSSVNNEFGSVVEIRGSNILLDLIGERLNYLDGVSIAIRPSEIFNSNIITSYKLVENGIKTFDNSQVVKCDIALPTI
jgi:hypothetical protein